VLRSQFHFHVWKEKTKKAETRLVAFMPFAGGSANGVVVEDEK
jgi:hypothetical protein